MSNIVDEISNLSGSEIVHAEVIAIAHILRLYVDSGWQIDLPASWRYRSSKSVILGSTDMDFYVDIDDEVLDEKDRFFTKKVASLIGLKLIFIKSLNGDLFFELSGGRFIDVFDLSSNGLSVLVKKTS